MKVTQILCAAGPVDAVTNQGLACRRLFAGWGWDGEDFAAVLAPSMERRVIRPVRELGAAGGELLVVHYSGYAPALERLLDGSRRSLLISHNVTPARYFWSHEPIEGVRCTLAPAQLAELARRADAVAAVSEFNAAELRCAGARDVEVIPVLFDRAALPPADGQPAGAPKVLFVGRLAPHKRQDLVIRAFARYRRDAPRAHLVLVGVPMSPEFEAQLRQLADELAPGAVTIESAVPAERLWSHYRSAHAFLCLSEHEGFCVPLLEAFHFGVPVIARDAAAVAETIGDAGVLLSGSDDLATVAELLHLVVGDVELREELRARAQLRLERFAYERTARRLRERLEALAAR